MEERGLEGEANNIIRVIDTIGGRARGASERSAEE
jgi:hypothetical protein